MTETHQAVPMLDNERDAIRAFFLRAYAMGARARIGVSLHDDPRKILIVDCELRECEAAA